MEQFSGAALGTEHENESTNNSPRRQHNRLEGIGPDDGKNPSDKGIPNHGD